MSPSKYEPIKTVRIFEAICAKIRGQIASGELKPGDRLPTERELAEQFAVSRTAVREAMRSLELFGLVEMRKGRSGGAFILDSGMSVVSRQLLDMLDFGRVSLSTFYEARRIIIVASIRNAGERITVGELDQLAALVDRIEELTSAGQRQERSKALLAFGEALVELQRNDVLTSIVKAMSDVTFSLSVILMPRDVFQPLGAQFREIVDALREGRVADAATLFELSSAAGENYTVRSYSERLKGLPGVK